MWVARDEDGSLWLFQTKPVREFDIWNIEVFVSDFIKIDPTLFPDIKWDDEPIEVDLVPKSKTNKTNITVTRENIILKTKK